MRITVVGTHEYALAPERATVLVRVDVEGTDRVETSRAAAHQVDALRADLEELRGRPGSPLTWFSVGTLLTRSWRPYSNTGEAMAPMYGASVLVRARFSDFGALAQATDAWARHDGVRLEDVTWEWTDVTRAKVEAMALTRAVEEARNRALAIAQASGYVEVEIEEVADPGLLGEQAPGPQPYGAATAVAMKRDGGGSPAGVIPDDLRGEARVHARFRAVR